MSGNPERKLPCGPRSYQIADFPLLTAVFALAIASRIVASFVLPNAEQDGYSYAEIIQHLTNQIQSGHFHVSDLYGFWLPGFPIISAFVNLIIHQPLIAGKIVNTVCGAISIVLVFRITLMITDSLLLALVGSGLLLLNPLHVLYSASCMTDVPHACVVLVSLWFASRRNWLGAALFAAISESIRIESWALIAALPLLQWLQERRVSIPAFLVLLVPPLAWFTLAFIATGSPLAYFAERARYHAEYIQFHPHRVGLQWSPLMKDVGYLLLGAGKIISAGAMFVAVTVLIGSIRNRKITEQRLLAPMIYGGAILALLVLAYITRSQPVWLPRYGLVFLGIGLPLFAVALQWSASLSQMRLVRRAIVVAVVGACLVEMATQQLPVLFHVRHDFRAHAQIAASLVADSRTAPGGARCFSDDVAVRVLSGLPPETFVRSQFAPAAAADDRENFLSWLRSQNVQWLIFFPTENSIPVKFFPELSKTGAHSPRFELIDFAHSSFGPDIWLYRIETAAP